MSEDFWIDSNGCFCIKLTAEEEDYCNQLATEKFAKKLGRGTVGANSTGIKGEFAFEKLCKKFLKNFDKCKFSYRENYEGYSNENDCFMVDGEHKKISIELKTTARQSDNSAGTATFIQKSEYMPRSISNNIVLAHYLQKETAVRFVGFVKPEVYNKNRDRYDTCGLAGMMQITNEDVYKLFYLCKEFSEEKVVKKEIKLKKDFVINQQTAENLGHNEMISSIVAGVHYFCKLANIYFKDINQQDECMIGDKKVKIYVRDAMMDDDMLVYDSYFQRHPEIDIYVLCKKKGGKYEYLGYVTREIVEGTRIVQMIGKDNDAASKEIRRIFAEQYLNLSDIIKIEVDEDEEEEHIDDAQSYVPLHMHSEYSVGDGFGTIKYICESLRKKGFRGAALTDHGTLAGVWEFQKAMLERDLKPVIGCELYVKIPESEKRFHAAVYVKNETGWKNLLKLQSLACREHFYYKPVVPYEELFKYHEGLIITAGCMSGLVPFLISQGELKKAEKWLLKMKEVFGEDLYVEIMLHKILTYQDTMQSIYMMAEENNIKCIFTTDSHYPNKEDIKYHEAIKAIGMRKKYGEAGYDDNCFYLMQEDDIARRAESIGWIIPSIISEFKQNTFEVFNKCDFKIAPPDELDTLPKFLPTEQERKEKLKELCIEGLEKYTPYKYEGKFKERLTLEMDRMLGKNYENYFLIVWDMVKWAKDNGIRVGPGRGSIGSSLAAYALNITECDPMEHDLLFDRFLSPIRRDMPDADLDFADLRRPEVFEYLKEKYGEKHCAKVITNSRFHARGTIRDVGRIFSLPSRDITKLCSMVIERSGGDARASFSLEDTFEEFAEAKIFKENYPLAAEIACRIEGHLRHKGVHAAAMVITEKETSEYVPLGKLNGQIVTEWEKFQTEDMKLVKFDILGLKTLTVIEDAVQMAKCELPKTFEDPKVYKEIFQVGNTAGVFQFETVGLTKLAQSINVKNFNELYDCTSLFRPGALHSGQTQVYVNRAQGKEECEPFHPLLTEISKPTKGIILYQEQIMKIMHQVGGMSWATAEMARKVITKSKGKDAFNKMRKEFVTNAHKIHKMPLEEAEKLYDVVSTFGSYGFNASHAVEYSTISYYCAWLKLYYPKHFFAALLKNESDKTSIFRYIQDAEKNGIKINYPDINKSKESYEIIDGEIYAGLNCIEGIASRTAQKIIKNQPYEDYEDFRKRCKVSSKIMKGLIIAEAFDIFGINKKVCYCADQKKSYASHDKLTKDFTEIEQTKLIYQHTSLKPNLDIISTFNFGDRKFLNIGDLSSEQGGEQVLIRGIVTDVLNKDKLLRNDLKEHEHHFEQHMIYININDGTGDVAAQINPWTYEKYSKMLEDIDKKPVLVLGMLTRDGKKIYADFLQVVEETNDIDKFYDTKGIFIASAAPAVSKKGNSYYRILTSDGVKGLCFRAPCKLFSGMKIAYRISKEPFIDIRVL